MTGQTEKSSAGPKATRKRQEQEEPEREPAGESGDLESSLKLPKDEPKAESIKSLESRVGGMEIVTITVQSQLASLEDYLFSRRAIARQRPPFIPLRVTFLRVLAIATTRSMAGDACTTE
ncbi:MAG: hypothetical protein R3B54_18035 [Bdellovibrionota bacterium]